MAQSVVLLSEEFQDFEIGMFSADVGPHTEYHYLAEAAPKHGWAVACFASREAGTAWHVADENGRRLMRQTYESGDSWAPKTTHPMISTGSFLWSDYSITVRFCPRSLARCGVVFRYHNNRCYYFFGFEEGRVILSLVQHETAFHQPYERIFASARCSWSTNSEYTATVELSGRHISGRVEEVRTGRGLVSLECEDDTYLLGKIALLADGPTDFYSVSVTSDEATASEIRRRGNSEKLELEALRRLYPQPVLWKKIVTRGFGVGRNIRFGDLDGDGRIEVAIGQMNALGPRDSYSEVGCITTMNFDGDVMWQSGRPDPEKYGLTNDVAFQVHDLDNDGRAEVIYARDAELVVADGITGEPMIKVPTPWSLPPADRYPRILGDCLFFCDVRGTGRAADVVIKDRYWHFWVLNDRFEPLWDGACRTGHYPCAADIDGDGKDELAIGFALYDHDGTLLWNLENEIQDHADGIAIVNLGGEFGDRPIIMYAASDSGLLFVDLEGNILRHHRIGHAQNPAIAKFRDDLAGLQILSINFWGNQGILHFYDRDGEIYHDAEPLNMGSMCLPVNWTGDGTELFVHNPNPVNGGMFDGLARPVVMFPDDGHPDMCNAVLDLTGDCRDEVVVWDQNELWVYTQEDSPITGSIYRPERNPLYNWSNYQASVSLPGWSATP